MKEKFESIPRMDHPPLSSSFRPAFAEQRVLGVFSIIITSLVISTVVEKS